MVGHALMPAIAQTVTLLDNISTKADADTHETNSG